MAAVRAGATVVKGFSLYPDQVDAMQAHALANDRTLSAEVRRAITRYLDALAAEKKMSQAAARTAPGSVITGQSRDHAAG